MSEQTFDCLKLGNQLCFPLYAASREIIKKYRPHLEKLDLTYTQYIAMMVFWEEKCLNVKDLGKKLFLDSGTLTPVLKSLEAKGYVFRYRLPEDERVVMVKITELGESLKEQAVKIPEALTACVPLPKEEAFQLFQLLHKLLNVISEN
ncbi:MAG: MarR family transcriptional regulator [Spirochaetaceae bacterium]|nr:MarR family transcriptional regulator [Spirochaetaceae bacterium]MBP3561826.1 MarR family transcriptional regulator [Treponema sp.]